MAQGEFLRAMPRILVYEGGRSDNPNDPGGRTDQGVTQATFSAYLRAKGLADRNVYSMTDAERDDIYKTLYWDKIVGDQLPMGVGFCVFDAAVNSGVGQSVKWLQSALGAAYAGEIDGQIGNKTLQAVEDHGDPTSLIEDFCSRRLGTLKRLRTWDVFGKGWSARISNVQKIACSWAPADAPSGLPQVDPVDVALSGGNRKATVTGNMSTPVVSQLTTHIGTAAGSAATIATQASSQFAPVADTFAWLKYVCGGLTIAAVIAGIVVKLINDADMAAEKGAALAEVDPDADSTFAAVRVVEPVLQPPQPPTAPIAKAA